MLRVAPCGSRGDDYMQIRATCLPSVGVTEPIIARRRYGRSKGSSGALSHDGSGDTDDAVSIVATAGMWLVVRC